MKHIDEYQESAVGVLKRETVYLLEDVVALQKDKANTSEQGKIEAADKAIRRRKQIIDRYQEAIDILEAANKFKHWVRGA